MRGEKGIKLKDTGFGNFTAFKNGKKTVSSTV